MAVRTRGSNAVAGTIMHSDRGTQYCSAAFQNRLMQLDMRCSMSDVGQCWDNAPGESIWSSLKRETLIGRKRFDSYEQAVYGYSLDRNLQYDSSSFDHRYAGACQL